LFQFGPFTVTSYGFMVALGIVVGLLVVLHAGKRRGMDTDTLLDLALYMIVAGVIGSRVAYVFLEWDQHGADPLSVLRIWDGGLSFFGALALCLVVLIWFVRRRGLSLTRVGDIVVLGVAAGYPFGRVGCFLNGCCYGLPTNHVFGVTFPFDEMARHPTQLYSVGFGVVIFLVVWALSRNRPFDGSIMWLFLVLYGGYRFLIDFWRVSPPSGIEALTVGQLISLAAVVAGGLALCFAWRRARLPTAR
jgi:phosphatidylglycerol:prolipoprotein diacylglycerol transferase